MSEHDRLDAENLVQVHKARDEWEGNIITGYLRNNGVEAVFQGTPGMPPLDTVEELSGSDKVSGILVLQHDAERARQLIAEFMTTATDEKLLDEAAAHKLKLDKETISRLRTALREERRTFDFLGWLLVVFLGSASLLWAIWPAWLKIEAPVPEFRWVIVIMLALAAVFAGNWANKRMQ